MPITALGDMVTASSTTSSSSPHVAALARAMGMSPSPWLEP
jgi:hypothetical protein